jgi:hypothetical protein
MACAATRRAKAHEGKNPKPPPQGSCGGGFAVGIRAVPPAGFKSPGLALSRQQGKGRLEAGKQKPHRQGKPALRVLGVRFF